MLFYVWLWYLDNVYFKHSCIMFIWSCDFWHETNLMETIMIFYFRKLLRQPEQWTIKEVITILRWSWPLLCLFLQSDIWVTEFAVVLIPWRTPDIRFVTKKGQWIKNKKCLALTLAMQEMSSEWVNSNPGNARVAGNTGLVWLALLYTPGIFCPARAMAAESLTSL